MSAIATVSANWKTVYIFISSTFNDMHAERDYLVKQVFPQLCEWCERRKLRLVDIDLRWGVTEADATQNKNVVGVCLDRIDECRPFFLCFLGQRYGWIPKPQDVSPDTLKKFPGLEKAVKEGASVTELEIIHSLFEPFHAPETIAEKNYHPAQYVFFYLRDDRYLSDLPQEPKYIRRVYTDQDEMNAEDRTKFINKQRQLLQKLKNNYPYRIYQAKWSPVQQTPELALPLQSPATLPENQERWRREWKNHAAVKVGGLDVTENREEESKARTFNQKVIQGRLTDFRCDPQTLGEQILADLKKAIGERFAEHQEIGKKDELQQELDQQDQFVFVNSTGYIKRRDDFTELNEYVNGNSRQLFVLTAEAGMGKSALLANWVNQYRDRHQNDPSESLHFRFIGASDGSTTVYSLLRSLLREIKEMGHKLESEIPPDPVKLQNALPELLQEIAQHGKTIIVIDALNQLETGLIDLTWLPRQLPENIKWIVSFKRGEKEGEDFCDNLKGDNRVCLSEVKPFADREDRKKLIQEYLSQYLKELDQSYLEALIDMPAARNPLYLKVLLSELRVYGAFSKLAEKIQNDFGNTPQSAFEGLLSRLETDPAYSPIDPKQAVPFLFGFLAHARHGLFAAELRDLLLQTLALEANEANQKNAADTVYLYLRQVRPFLARRNGRYDFFYESFKNAALSRYVGPSADSQQAPKKEWHKRLAKYFECLPLWDKEKAGLENKKEYCYPPNYRKVAELPYHLIHAEEWEQTTAILCDLWFIEAKIRAGLVYELIDDYMLAQDLLPENQEEKQKEQKQEDQRRQYTENLFALAQGTISALDLLPSRTPWNEEQIKQGTERIMTSPTRADRLRVYAQLVSMETPDLAKFGSIPGFFWQKAYNSAHNGLIAKASENLMSKGVEVPLLLLHPSQRPDFNPYPALIKSIAGHAGGVNCILLSPDGKKIISGSKDKMLKVWDPKSGKCLRTLRGHLEEIMSISITADGTKAISGSGNRYGGAKTRSEVHNLRVWDLETGACTAILDGHNGSVFSVGITPDGKRAVSTASDEVLKIWNLENLTCFKTIHCDITDRVNALQITADGKRFISCSSTGTVQIWDLFNGNCLKELNKDEESLNDGLSRISITPDGKRAVLSGEIPLQVWDLEKAILRFKTQDEDMEAVDASITPDGRILVLGGYFSLQVWNLENGKFIKNLDEYKYANCVSVSADGKWAVSGEDNGIICIWDLERGQGNKRRSSTGKAVKSINFTPTGKSIVSNEGNSVRVWDFAQAESLYAITKQEDSTYYQATPNLIFSPDGQKAFWGEAEHLRVLDIATGKCSDQSHFVPFPDKSGLIIAPDGKRALIGTRGSFQVWDLEKLKSLYEINTHSDSSTAIAFTPDGKRVITAAMDNTLQLWDLQTGYIIWSATLEDNTAQSRKDIENKKRIAAMTGKTDWVDCVAITPDGKRAVSGSMDHQLRIWNLDTGQCLKMLQGHSGWIETLDIIPDGKKAVSSCADYSIRVWDLATGQCLQILPAFEERIESIKITPDGRHIIIHSNYQLRIWSIEQGTFDASFQVEGGVSSFSDLRSNGYMACGTLYGEVKLITGKNLARHPPQVTAVRIWRYGPAAQGLGKLFAKKRDSSGWDAEITAMCPWCGERFALSQDMVQLISGISKEFKLGSEQSPCLELTIAAWENPLLKSNCPLCGQKLQFNPFIVDNQNYYTETQSRPKELHRSIKKVEKMHQQGKGEQALSLLQEQEKIGRRTGDKTGLLLSLNRQAQIYLDQGDQEKALALYQEQERISREIGDKGCLQNALGNQAAVYQAQEKWDPALSLAREREKICRELMRHDLFNRNISHVEGLEESLFIQANIHWRKGALSEALALFQEQEKLCRNTAELQNKLMPCLRSQIGVLIPMSEWEKAMPISDELENICRKAGDLQELAYALSDKADILFFMNRFADAKRYLQEAEQLHRTQNNKMELMINIGKQAEVLTKEGFWDQPLVLLDEMEELGNELNAKDELNFCLGLRKKIIASKRARTSTTRGSRLIDFIEKINQERTEKSQRLETLGNQALALKQQGNWKGALTLFAEYEALCREMELKEGLVFALFQRAEILKMQGDLDASLALFQEQERLCREIGNLSELQAALGFQALILLDRGDQKGAMALLKQEEQICRENDIKHGLQFTLLKQAEILMVQGNLDGALTLLQEQEQICRAMDNKIDLQSGLCNQALIQQSLGDPEKALALFMEEERICREAAFKPGLKLALGKQAEILRGRSAFEVALQKYEEYEALCRELNDPAALQAGLGDQGLIYKAKGEFEKALKLFKEQEKICREQAIKRVLQFCLSNQAEILKTQNNIEEALRLYQEQGDICKELQNHDQYQVALSNQAALFLSRKDWDQALALYQKEEQVCREHNLKNGLQFALEKQGWINFSRKNFDQALVLYREQANICRELGEKNNLQMALGNQGLILKNRGDLDAAMVLYREQEAICREINSKQGLYFSLSGQAEILKNMKDFDNLLTIYREQEKLGIELSDWNNLPKILDNLAGVLYYKKEYDLALAKFKENEQICRKINHHQGVALSMIKQAVILSNSNRASEGMALAQNAYQMALDNKLTNLVQQITKSIEDIKSKLPQNQN